MANAYQQLLKSKGAFCKGKTTKSAVRKKAKAYIKTAVNKAKKNGEPVAKARVKATKSANRVLNAGCKVSSVAGSKKKKRAAKRKA